MKKLAGIVSLLLVLALIPLMSSCRGAFAYDRDTAVKNAQGLIESGNSGDYQAVSDRMHEVVRSQIPVESLRDSWEELLESSGDFVGYEEATTSVATQNGVNYIVVVVPCKYENNTRTYTVTYTEDFKVVALEMV
jgi:hypothetical protein